MSEAKVDYHSTDSNKMAVLRNYTFDLALENANCIDWTTEKVYQSLAAGTIPIYMGNPSVERQLPHPDSIIRVSDFPTMASLVDYLSQVAKSPQLLAKHHAWRKIPPDGWPIGFRHVHEQFASKQPRPNRGLPFVRDGGEYAQTE